MKLYDATVSGNCYKVRLLLSHLGLSYERVPVDVVSRENRKALLQAMNPASKIPILELDDGRHLAESNAILWYLADGTPYLPDDALARARVLQWMFFEQNNLEPNLAVARYLMSILGRPEEHAARLAQTREAGTAGLQVVEHWLAEHPFLVEGRYSIADIALFAYIHVAPEGGFELAPYGAVSAWIERVRAQPGHVRIGA